MNPFNLPGPEFLELFAIVLTSTFAVCFVLASFLRSQILAMGADGARCDELELDPYETAFLAGGEVQAVQTAIGALVHRNVLVVQDGLLRKEQLRANISNPLEKGIESALSSQSWRSANEDMMRHTTADALGEIRARLEELGLILTKRQSAKLYWPPRVILMAALLFGLLKIFVGMSRGRPIGFLLALCILAGAAGWSWFGFISKSATRTPAGDRLLASRKTSNAALEHLASLRPDTLSGADFALAMGLFSTTVLASAQQAALFAALRKGRQTVSSRGSGWSFWGGGDGGCGGGGGCGGCGGGM
ncbi:MAG: TIGR04222 domain-containing membrane protein [Planctomycetota bacterium]